MKFSIIVPVYNVESYLAECLDSILNQSCQDYEIICVNDASTDDSYDILLTYAEKNSQIKVINNRCNKGLSFNRNLGICEAKGEYILFVDSDDMLIPEALEILAKALKDDVEMVSFRYFIKNEGKLALEQDVVQDDKLAFCESMQTGQKWFIERAQEERIWITAWTQVYKREFLLCHNLKFYEGLLHEDLLYIFQCALKAQRVVYIPQFIYIYRRRDRSITSTVNELRLDSYLVVLGEILAEWRLNQKQLEKGMNDAITGYIDSRLIPAIKKLNALFPEHNQLEIGCCADQFLFDLYKGTKQHQYRYVRLEDSEISYIKKYNEIVVFGAGIVAAELIMCLRGYEINIKMVAVSDKSLNMSQIEKIDICQIEDLLGMRETALIIVAVFSRNQKTVLRKLKSLGFQNVMCIDTDKISGRS